MLGCAHGCTRVPRIIAEGGREPLQAQQHLPWYLLPVPLVMRSRREGDMGARMEIPQSWLNPHLAQLEDMKLPSGKVPRRAHTCAHAFTHSAPLPSVPQQSSPSPVLPGSCQVERGESKGVSSSGKWEDHYLSHPVLRIFSEGQGDNGGDRIFTLQPK